MALIFRQLYASLGIILLHYAYGNLYAVFSILRTSLDGEGSDVVEVTADQNVTIVTAFIISAAIGKLSCGFMADRFGRKMVLAASALPGILGCLLLQSAQEFWQIIIAAAGIGLTGAGLVLGQIYIAEITSSKYRGLILSLTLAAAAIGNTVGENISTTTFGNGWRRMVSYDVIFVVIFLVSSMIIPESPIWLASKQKFVQCSKNISWLRSDEDSSIEYEELLEKQLDISSKLKNTQPKAANVCAGCLKTFFKSLFISFACIIIVEANGKSTLHKLGTEFLNEITGTEEKFTYLSVIFSVIELTAVSLSCVLMLYFKRKSMLLSSGILTVFSSALFSITSYYISSGRLKTSLLFIPLCSLIIYVFFINLALVPVVYVINREIFPIFYRGAGLSISSLGDTLVLLSVVKIFPWILQACSLHGLFAIISIILLLSFLFVYCYCPETHGSTLKEIDDMFERDNGAIVFDESRLAYHTLPNDSSARNILWNIDR